MERINFNRDWRVMKGGNSASTAAFMGIAEVQSVHLPHDAMIHEARTPDVASGAQTGFYPGREYIYQKTLTAPEEWKEKAVFLEFEGIYQTAMVYINGALAATNLYGYSNFYVKLNPWLNYGTENTVKVIADNSLVPNSRWYTGSGIYRNVKLIVGDRIHVPNDGIRITTLAADTESAIIEVETKVQSISKERERQQLYGFFWRKTVNELPRTARWSLCTRRLWKQPDAASVWQIRSCGIVIIRICISAGF